MPSSDGPAPLPDLLQSVLGPTDLDALFRDIGSLTRVLEIIPKHGPRDHVPDAPVSLSLDEARTLLDSGAICGLQIRYVHDNTQWWDTLLRTPEGVRIVRIQHEA